jgi:hypothetical protein
VVCKGAVGGEGLAYWGIYQAAVFPRVYARYTALLFDRLPLLVYGKVCEEWRTISIEVEKVKKIM